MTNLYLSFDIEADGPSPCRNNMLSLGICGLTDDANIVYKYCKNLKPLENHVIDPDTKARFWDKNPELWEKVNQDQVTYCDAMQELANDLANLRSNGYVITWIAMPAAYDWQWLNYYWNYAIEKNVNLYNQTLGFKAECLSTAWKTFTSMNGKSHSENDKLWNDAYGNNEHKHNAYYDALHQGLVYINLLKYIKNATL